MDWNNDGKQDWQDTAMDMYVMDQISNDNGESHATRSVSSGNAIVFIVIWIVFCIFISFLGTL